MTCKYLGEQHTIIPGGREVGGPLTPSVGPKVPYCKAGRNPTDWGWQGRCQKTNENGPCWFWVEEHVDEPDPAFQQPTDG